MKEPMKCEQIKKEAQYFDGKEIIPEQLCGGELEEKGKIPTSEFGMVVGSKTLCQCKVCKDIKII